ncbi:MAG: glycogen debranching protein [Ignavibacteriales bacterium]
MKLFYASAILLLLFISTPAQEVLYRSDLFTIFPDRVVQGKFSAVARSRGQIVSDYKSSFRKNTSRTITMKFSINGLDNERAPGQDHHFFLQPGNAVDTAYFVFGKADTGVVRTGTGEVSPFLEKDHDMLIRLNMRNVLADIKEKGSYKTYDGSSVTAADFKGVYVAGANEPLSWNFPALPERPEFRLTDPDGDGIYEAVIHFPKEFMPEQPGSGAKEWKLSKDISRFPRYESPSVLVDALYNRAIEEMMMDVRDDGAFMAGAQWTGVWTRDISYSIFLSLAIVNPDASKTSLMAKVKDGRIIQDTGTGGAWPVSSDRMTWALAAWEIFRVTGDRQWLRTSYDIIKKSAMADLNTVYDAPTGLFRGESSFLDWREQTYPRWMDPRDIYESKNLGTNAVHYETYRILSAMAAELKEPDNNFTEIAGKVRTGVNKYLWMADKGYYGQYLYGRNYFSLSPRSEALGEALCVLFDGLAPAENQKAIIRNTPVTGFGVPCIYPQIPNIPPYHNNSVWPFVESLRAWASARAGNTESVLNAMACVYRPAALFLTNKENLVASTGDYMGTEINSDRQLWSIAGNLALTYRIIMGMNFTADSLYFRPFIPEEYKGIRTLRNFRYRNSNLSVTVKGFGNGIATVTMDGRRLRQAAVAGSLKGNHEIVITMNNKIPKENGINMLPVDFAPETPALSMKEGIISWKPVKNASGYFVFRNGKKAGETSDTVYSVSGNDTYSEYQVLSADSAHRESFLSEPAVLVPEGNIIVAEAETGSTKTDSAYQGFTGHGYLLLDKSQNRSVEFQVDVPETGLYSIGFRYANGNGPINTENKCAIRTLNIDSKEAGPVIMPQRGDNLWNNWGYSNSLHVELSKGMHLLTLTFTASDDNMNGEVNSALLDNIRLILLDKVK